MKFNVLIILILGVVLISCKDDFQETTQMEFIDFVPDEAIPNILDEYPNGVMSFSLNNEETVTVERATVMTTSKETLILTEVINPDTGNSARLIIGAKGFSVGDFQGNIFGLGLSPSEYNLSNITFTSYGELGEVVSGYFSASYVQFGTQISFSGEFDGLRVN